jgi:hypothetical protein
MVPQEKLAQLSSPNRVARQSHEAGTFAGFPRLKRRTPLFSILAKKIGTIHSGNAC